MKKNLESSNVQLQKELDFLNNRVIRWEIIKLWEKCQRAKLKGYIKCYVKNDYKRFYPGNPKFVEGRVKKSAFIDNFIYPPVELKRKETETEEFALVHFYWEATYTHYRVALRYIKGIYKDWDLTIKN